MRKTRFINVRSHLRRLNSGKRIRVRKHRRQVKRQLPKRIANSTKNYSSDDLEYAFGFDWDRQHKNVESILILRGKEAWTIPPSEAKVAIASEDESERFVIKHRDYEISAHTHPPINNIGVKYPSPDDIVAFIQDPKERNYEIIFIGGSDNAIILHIKPKTRERLLEEHFQSEQKAKKLLHTIRREWYKAPLKGGRPTRHNRKVMDKLMRKWENDYNIEINRVSLKQLSNYQFRIIPQDGPNDR